MGSAKTCRVSKMPGDDSTKAKICYLRKNQLIHQKYVCQQNELIQPIKCAVSEKLAESAKISDGDSAKDAESAK